EHFLLKSHKIQCLIYRGRFRRRLKERLCEIQLALINQNVLSFPASFGRLFARSSGTGRLRNRVAVHFWHKRTWLYESANQAVLYHIELRQVAERVPALWAPSNVSSRAGDRPTASFCAFEAVTSIRLFPKICQWMARFQV